MDLIEIKQLSKRYNEHCENEVHALEAVDLSIKKGAVVAIVGRSGAGKTTLLHILGCLDQATEGEYFLDGTDVTALNQKQLARIRNQRIGFVLQEFGLLMNKSVFDNVIIPLIFAPDVGRNDLRMKAVKVLEQVNLLEKIDETVAELSGGQKQRVAIARAIINDQDIILADEPTGALDTTTAKNIMDLFLSLREQGKTVIIVTHDLKIANCCDYILNIEDGFLTKPNITELVSYKI